MHLKVYLSLSSAPTKRIRECETCMSKEYLSHDLMKIEFSKFLQPNI